MSMPERFYDLDYEPSEDEFRLFVVDGFLSYIMRQNKMGAPPLCENPEAERLTKVLAETCPGFPINERVHDVLFMFAVGLNFGLETARDLIEHHKNQTKMIPPWVLPQ